MRPVPIEIPATNKTIKQFARLGRVKKDLNLREISIETITLANERPL
jgi:hypothetical protein